MIPEEIIKAFNQWSVTDVYDEWDTFAIELSRFAHKIAIEKAREESDARTAMMHEYITNLMKVHEEETKKDPKDLTVYTSPKYKVKDMR